MSLLPYIYRRRISTRSVNRSSTFRLRTLCSPKDCRKVMPSVIRRLCSVCSQLSSGSSSTSSYDGTAAEEKKINIEGLNLNYRRVGAGPIPVLCLPGLLGSIQSDFEPIMSKFDLTKFTMIAWDPPGFGKSRPPARKRKENMGIVEEFQIDAHLATMLMKALGYKRFCTIGWSGGGASALFQSINYSALIDKMVVFGAVSYLIQRDWINTNKLCDLSAWSPAIKNGLIAQYGEEYICQVMTHRANAIASCLANQNGIICNAAELNSIQCPTLIIHGLKDPIIQLSSAEYLKENIKHSRLHLMPDAKHYLHLTHSDEFVKLVEDFLLNNQP